jgi:hypothetical protein
MMHVALFPAIRALANILNGVERQAAELPLCALPELALDDLRRLVYKATAIVRGCDKDVEFDALDEVARRLAEGANHEYASFESQAPSVQAYYHRLAAHALNGYWSVLIGDR